MRRKTGSWCAWLPSREPPSWVSLQYPAGECGPTSRSWLRPPPTCGSLLLILTTCAETMNTTRSLELAAWLLAFALTGMGSAVAQSPPASGPTHILITYRSEPANRPAFRSYLQRDLL